jgi:hypothetical protein
MYVEFGIQPDIYSLQRLYDALLCVRVKNYQYCDEKNP